MGIGQYMVDIAAPYGSLYEPNLFGAYTAFCAVLFLALYLVGEKHRRGFLICYLVASLAAALSLSRAVLVALVIASGWVFWKARRHETTYRNSLTFLVPVSALVLIMGVTVVGGVMRERFADLFSQGLEEETTLIRYVVITEALKNIPNHPLLGTGTASLQLSFEWTTYVPEWGNERAWVANVIVRILHDTGFLGLSAFLAFVISLWLKIRQALRGQNSQLPMLVGLSAGALLYSISFQSTDGTILAFSWVHLGLLASAAILMNGVGDFEQ
jgi:O-antigen ligase